MIVIYDRNMLTVQATDSNSTVKGVIVSLEVKLCLKSISEQNTFEKCKQLTEYKIFPSYIDI